MIYLNQCIKKENYSDEKIKENAGSEILGIITHDTIEQI